ncbi:hypothetical protein BB778_15790 [Pluralibacter gergoviae]|uniref:SDR family NAD(P)-dependent oxidoreductase n=1 Tax=Pluralibacter gergoviae TaxID=61647 RepID=UPI0008DC0CFF|nr:SDR family oxidoreductase [Pluralibacter gergoviae]OHY67537.1 hypothetical protein BB778_15790 [Pluralibacter gergoviae]
MGSLTGKISVITGAGSGVGRETAILFARASATVILVGRGREHLEETQAKLAGYGNRSEIFTVDMQDSAQIVALFAALENTFGRIDILVNNAGIIDNFKTVDNTSDELWDAVIDTNLKGPFVASREAIKLFNKYDIAGNIINISSIGGISGTWGGAAYISSKHGLIGLTRNIAATHGAYGKIRANAIAPGGIDTSIRGKVNDPDPLGMKAVMANANLPTAQPEQIAEVALFLASEASNAINGEVIVADQGWSAR